MRLVQKCIFSCIIITTIIMCAACNTTEPKWVCSVLTGENSYSSKDVTMENTQDWEIWNQGYYTSDDAPKEKTISFNGTVYTGSYIWSICATGSGIIKDYYQANNSEANFLEFGVNRETGELTGINFVTKNYYKQNAEADVLEQVDSALPKLASTWASYFIDTDKYVMRLHRTIPQTDPEMTTYVNEFVRVVNGLDTTDMLQVMISDRGLLGYIDSRHLGWVEKNERLLKKMETLDPDIIVQGTSSITDVTIEGKRYGITPDGDVVMLVNCSGKVVGKYDNTTAVTMVIWDSAQ